MMSYVTLKRKVYEELFDYHDIIDPKRGDTEET